MQTQITETRRSLLKLLRIFQSVKNFGLLAIPIFFVFTYLQWVHAAPGSEAYIWAPSNVITGEVYEGTVILDSATDGYVVVLSASDPSVAEIPKSVYIGPHSNHGIFQIRPLKEGSVTIFGVIQGRIVSTPVSVYSSSGQSESLRIVLAANATKTEEMAGYILSADSRGNPAPVTKDTTVNLSSSPLIDVEPQKVRIEKGQYYSKFLARIKGSGSIYASSESLRLAEYYVTKIQDDITVRVGIAPNIMLENSRAFFFVWLEKNGQPYKPPYVLYAFVSSSNLKSIRFNENLATQYGDAILKVPIVGGVGVGRLVSAERGSSIITASVDGVGTGQDSASVGPALVDEGFQFIESDVDRMRRADVERPNIAIIWLYPSITDSRAYGVVGLYNANLTRNTVTAMTANGTEVSVSSSVNRIVPVPIDGRTITLSSSSGLGHPKVLALFESGKTLPGSGIGSTHAAQFEVSARSHGNHTLYVSGPGLEQYYSKISIAPPFGENYEIKVTHIPSMPGRKADLALISVSDGSGALEAQSSVLQAKFSVSAGTHLEEIDMAHNSATYSATASAGHKITISAAGMAPKEEVLNPSGVASAVSIDVPPKVHITEPFPFAVHDVDSYGIPVRKTSSANILASDKILIREGRMIIESPGTQSIGVVSEGGVDSISIESFANTFKMSVIPSGITNRVEREFQLGVVSDVDDFNLTVDSPFPYRAVDGRTLAITPDKTGTYNITLVATKSGYMPSRAEFTVSAEKFVSLSIAALSSSGDDLNVQQQLTLGNLSRNVITPFHAEIIPQFLHLGFPQDTIISNIGYRLGSISFGDQSTAENRINGLFVNTDTNIVAYYDRMVRVEAEGALGSGLYRHGETVTLSVPPKDRLWIFVRDVFDHWEGINHTSDQAVFVATNDIRARAILREDYTVLMLAAVAAVSIASYQNLVRRRRLDVSFYLAKIRPFYLARMLGGKTERTERHDAKHDVGF